MIKNYKLICDEDWTVVESQVNEQLLLGYQPLGSPFVFTQKDDQNNDQQLICQAIILNMS